MSGGRLHDFVHAASMAGRHAWTWWVAELAQLLPARWRSRHRQHIEACIEPDRIRVKIVRASSQPAAETCLDLSGLPMASVASGGLFKREGARLPVWLVPPADEVLNRTVEVPRSVVRTFDKFLALQIDRWTSFSVDEIHVGWRVVIDRQRRRWRSSCPSTHADGRRPMVRRPRARKP